MVGRRLRLGALCSAYTAAFFLRWKLCWESPGLCFLIYRMGAMPSHMVILKIKYAEIGISPLLLTVPTGSDYVPQISPGLVTLLLQPIEF